MIPVIGDGALTGGMALEALNHIGHEQKNMIVVLNDNEMSIAPNVGALHNVLGRLRTAGKYQWAKDELEAFLKKIPAVGGKIASTAERLKDSLKYLLVSGVFLRNSVLLILDQLMVIIMKNYLRTLIMPRKQKVLFSYM